MSDNFELIDKYLSGEISEQELDQLSAWLRENAVNRECFNLENEIWRYSEICVEGASVSENTAWMKLSKRLDLNEEISEEFIFFRKPRFRLLLTAASVMIAVILSVALIQYSHRTMVRNQLLSKTFLSNNTGERSHLFLSDSTEVFLNSRSILSFNGSYNLNNREIDLSGEAFFSVRSDPEKPFIVNLGKIRVIVTGTSFNISSYEDDPCIKTTLVAGRLNVSINDGGSVQLNPGEQCVFYRVSEDLMLTRVSTDIHTDWIDNKLRLIDVSLDEVIRKISRKYNVDIEVSDTSLYSLRYTATITDEPIETVMKILKAVSPIEYKYYKPDPLYANDKSRPKIVIFSTHSIN